MVKYKRLYRIYRFYIIGILFCIQLPNLVSNYEDIYKILYTIPTLTIVFYPIYATIIIYSDITFLVDYLYYYINPTREILLRFRDSKKYLLRKIVLSLVMIFLKYLIINIFIFDKLLLFSCFINTLEELLIFYISVKLFKDVSLDKVTVIVLIILMVVKQYINPFFC